MPEREQGAVLIRIVDAEPPLGNGEVGIHLRHRPGKAGIPDRTDGRLGHITREISQSS